MDGRQLTEQLLAGFGASARVFERRPGLIFQVEIPAYLADGDAVNVFVRSESEGWVTVTDLGQTVMRISYVRAITESVRDELEKIADRHGFKFFEGQFHRRAPVTELLTHVLALAQIEVEAETQIGAKAPREIAAERFKSVVRDVLRETFGPSHVQFDYRDKAHDPGGLYALDALVRDRKIGIAVVPSEADAERAVATKLVLEPAVKQDMGPITWLALPRNLDALPKKTQARVTQFFEVPMRQVSAAPLSRYLRESFANESVR